VHIFDIIRNLLLLPTKYKCLVHTAIGNDEYFKTASKLELIGIKFKVRTRYTTRYGSEGIGMDSSQYDFYVQRSDEHLAYEVIRNKCSAYVEFGPFARFFGNI